jgi:hypothetical protein
MSFGTGRTASQELTRIRLVLSPGRSGPRWAAWSALVFGLLWIVAGSGYLYLGQWRADPAPAAAALQATRPLQQRLEQGRLALSLSEARSHELERQIDALNQRLRECQEELAFFRKAGERKR